MKSKIALICLMALFSFFLYAQESNVFVGDYSVIKGKHIPYTKCSFTDDGIFRIYNNTKEESFYYRILSKTLIMIGECQYEYKIELRNILLDPLMESGTGTIVLQKKALVLTGAKNKP
jgi:hypothetical protein